MIFVAMPKRALGSVEDAWIQFMWMVNTARGERITMMADFRNGYDRAISWLMEAARKTPELEMMMMLDSDIQPEIALKTAVDLARESLDNGYGVVMSPVPSQTLRVMVAPVTETSTTEPYDVLQGAVTNFGFIKAEALLSLDPIGEWGDVESRTWPAYIEERIANGTGDTHLCRRLRELGWKLRADPRLLCNHAKVARIQSARPKSKITFDRGEPEKA